MAPTICDGRMRSLGKKYPVTLVKTVVARKSPVQPSRLLELNIPNRTTRPATMPTRLKTTWTKVKVDNDIPKIIAYSLSKTFCSLRRTRLHDRHFLSVIVGTCYLLSWSPARLLPTSSSAWSTQPPPIALYKFAYDWKSWACVATYASWALNSDCSALATSR